MAATKAAYTHVGPGLPPLYGARAKALILGSFPSPKSREQGFFYGHPQNRFWPLMASLTGEPVPDWQDIEAKKAVILKHGLAVWDTIGACDIRGASDASIRNVEPNDVAALIRKLGAGGVLQRRGFGACLCKICPGKHGYARRGAAQHQPRQRGVVDGPSAHRLGPGTAAFFAGKRLRTYRFCSIIRTYRYNFNASSAKENFADE